MMNIMHFYEAGKPRKLSFVSNWDTRNVSTGSSSTDQIKLPLTLGATYDMLVEWGDGTTSAITSVSQPEVTHSYSAQGIKKIVIRGKFNGLVFGNSNDRLKLLSIERFGVIKFPSNIGIFSGCSNLKLDSVSDVPDLSNTTTLASFFAGCSSLITINKFSEWKTENIINFQGFLANCTNFNQLISFTTENATNFNTFFQACVNFNQPVTFNSSKVTNMAGMFLNCQKLNSEINLDTSSVTNMDSMFKACSVFNKELNFNTSSVTNMFAMFSLCYAFNQYIGNWDVSKVTNMNYLFENAIAYNQNLSTLNFNKNVTLVGFMVGKTAANYSASNYDALLQKWATVFIGTGRTQTNKTIGMGSIKYTSAGKPYRDALVADGWTITDGGMV